MMVRNTGRKLAVLIDADNARFSIVNLVLSEIAKYGTAQAKRAYGDWSSPCLKGWKDKLLEQSIQPIQQFAYTQGKNATDSAMIIDAMDLLHSGRYDGFCVVSSDSDFTRLATRIRESGLTVYGIGEQKTPKSFVVACDKFIYTENLAHTEKQDPHADSVNEGVSSAKNAQKKEHLASQLQMAVEAASNDDGWARLSDVGSLLTTMFPDFDPRTYGYRKLSDLMTASSRFEINHRSVHEGASTEMYVRDLHRKAKLHTK